MLPSDYVTQSLETEARDFSPVIERLQDPALMALTLQLFAEMGFISTALDGVKKNIFYGKEVEGISESKSTALQNAAANGILQELQIAQGSITSSNRNVRLLHAIIGLSSEIGEMIECYMEAMANGTELDVTNMKEEAGDLNWYQSIMLDSLGSNYEEIWQMNRNKLDKRYAGRKFTEDQANNRNLEVERQTLEGSQQ